jgi:hypothetical protein
MFSDPKFKSNFKFSVSIPQLLDHVEVKTYLLFDAIDLFIFLVTKYSEWIKKYFLF